MSTRHQLDRAVRRATTRDNKRRRKMSVTGRNVFILSQLLGRSKRKK